MHVPMRTHASIDLHSISTGGDDVNSNVLFNTCRESSDHGPINSWDRQVFVALAFNVVDCSRLMARRSASLIS